MIESVYKLDKSNFSHFFPTLPFYRFSQIDFWRSQGIDDFSLYKNIGKEAQELLSEKCNAFSSKVIDIAQSEDSKKLLIELSDKERIECVYMVDSKGERTICLSSQCGCACGCRFCATGTLGLKRNLEFYEILEQYYHLKRMFKEIDKIVYMGMGEPLLNLDNVAKSIEYLKENEHISSRRITISTCGIANKIRTLADMRLGVKLTLSLVTANQKLRQDIMPVASKNTLAELKKALLYFQKKDNRRITLAYCMLKGVNMDKKNVDELKEFSSSLVCHINLIPWNKIESLDFSTPEEKDILNFENILKKSHFIYSTRYSKGEKISAACGQLVAKRQRGINEHTR